MSEVPRPHEFNIYKPHELEQFYRDVLGYDALKQDPETGNWLIETRNPEHPVKIAGEVPEDAREKPVLIARFFVMDINACKERVVACGGGIDNLDVLEARDEGKTLLCTDPNDNMFILFEPVRNKGVAI